MDQRPLLRMLGEADIGLIRAVRSTAERLSLCGDGQHFDEIVRLSHAGCNAYWQVLLLATFLIGLVLFVLSGSRAVMGGAGSARVLDLPMGGDDHVYPSCWGGAGSFGPRGSRWHISCPRRRCLGPRLKPLRPSRPRPRWRRASCIGAFLLGRSSAR